MPKSVPLSCVILCFLAFATAGATREKRPNAAIELLNAARLADLRAADEHGFVIRAAIKLEEANGAETEGSYLLASSSTAWREEFSFDDFHQVRISAPGGVWEERDPYFLSLRVWQLMKALAFYGRFTLNSSESAGNIKHTRRNGTDLRCIRISRHSNPTSELCFLNDLAQLVTEHYLPAERQYELGDYKTIRNKFFPGRIRVFDHKLLAAEFSVSEVKESDSIPPAMFQRPLRAQWRPWCASPESGGDPLSPIYANRSHGKGTSTVYGAIGPDGRWHAVHILESGGARHDAEVLDTLKRERWIPTTCNGVPIVVETVSRR